MTAAGDNPTPDSTTQNASTDTTVGASDSPDLSTCPKCGGNRVLRRQASRTRPVWRCTACNARQARESRRRKRQSITQSALTRRLSADRLGRLIESLVRSHGSEEALWAALSTAERAKLLGRMVERQAQAQTEAELIDRRHREQVDADLNDPAVKRQMAATAIEWLHEHPEHLEPHLRSILSRKPSLLHHTGALADSTVLAVLRRMGWTIEPPPSSDCEPV